MLPVKKIYIDSRQSTSDTQNSSNFRIELDRSYKLPNDTLFFYNGRVYTAFLDDC